MDQTTTTTPTSRALGVFLIACATGSVVLLVMHPGGSATNYADVLKLEAAQRLQSAIVHGGTVGVLAAELAALAVLASRITSAGSWRIVALTLSAISFGFLAGSLTLDGLVVPDVAARYLAAPPASAVGGKALFVLLGSLIRFLMPMGLAFQGVAALAWGLTLWRSTPSRRVAGGVALVSGAVLLAALGATIATLNDDVVMAAFPAQALWLVVLGAGLVRKPA